jgi:hypothetical protein
MPNKRRHTSSPKRTAPAKLAKRGSLRLSAGERKILAAIRTALREKPR